MIRDLCLSKCQSARAHRGKKGSESVSSFLSQPHLKYLAHSILSLSKRRPFSTAWVRFANSFDAIFDCTHSKRSGSIVIPVLTLCRSIFGLPIKLVNIQPKLINIWYLITNQNKLKLIELNKIGGELNGWKYQQC